MGPYRIDVVFLEIVIHLQAVKQEIFMMLTVPSFRSSMVYAICTRS